MNRIYFYLAAILLVLSITATVAIRYIPEKEKDVYMKTNEGFWMKVDTRFMVVDKSEITCDDKACYFKRDYSIPMPGDLEQKILQDAK